MKKIILITVAMVAMFTITLQEAKARLSGQEIMEKVYHNPTGNDMQSELTMTLINARGEERVRQLKQFTRTDDDVEKKIMFFVSPADVRNTSFMNYSYNDGRDDDQWIYLPALSRVRRISSDGKSDYFMGSDFTYDDLGERHPDEDTHALKGEEVIDGQACYVVESIPKDASYMYSKTITWVMKDNYLGLKREFYDRDGKLLKTLQIKEFDQVDGFWTILETEMHNVQRSHRTVMSLENVQYNAGVRDNQFTERAMTLGL
jgi:outer membrane lipoprotein-sorting protein